MRLDGWSQTGHGTCVSVDPRTNVSRWLSIWRSSNNTVVGRENNVVYMDSFFKGRGLGYVHLRSSLYHLLAASRKMHQSLETQQESGLKCGITEVCSTVSTVLWRQRGCYGIWNGQPFTT